MKLRIGPREGLRVQASHTDRIEPDFARALRMAYRLMRTRGLSRSDARSLLLTCYEVGVAAGTVEQDAWYEARRRDDARARALANGAVARHPSTRSRLTVVPS